MRQIGLDRDGIADIQASQGFVPGILPLPAAPLVL